MFPWALCLLYGCLVSHGGKTYQWHEAKRPSLPIFGEWQATVMRPCVQELPPWPLTEKVESKIEFEMESTTPSR